MGNAGKLLKAEVDEHVEQCDETVDDLEGCKTDEAGKEQVALVPEIGPVRR